MPTITIRQCRECRNIVNPLSYVMDRGDAIYMCECCYSRDIKTTNHELH